MPHEPDDSPEVLGRSGGSKAGRSCGRGPRGKARGDQSVGQSMGVGNEEDRVAPRGDRGTARGSHRRPVQLPCSHARKGQK
eukprot:6046646-Lingulodinium_polyedra.AAC.1